MEHQVTMKVEKWNFFDHQRSIFKEMFKGMDREYAELDSELENIHDDIDPDGSMFIIRGRDNPIVTDTEGNKRLSLRFDLIGHKPEEITVKTSGNTLVLEAHCVRENSNQHLTRRHDLPDKIDPTTLTSVLSADGVLTIEAPAPQDAEARTTRILPIECL